MSPAPEPNFFVVGAAKAGTTSLYRYLSQHPQIYMSPVKEPCYFASEIRAGNLSAPMQRHIRLQSKSLARLLNDGRPTNPMGWLVCDWDEYLRLFRQVQNEVAVGEASAAYLWSATAAANIHARCPDARIVMILRDPAERAFSQYLHQLSVGLTRASFREHITQCMASGPRELGITYPFLEIGLYAQQVRRYLDCFPREQIRIYWYEEAWRHPEAFLTDVFRFLRVDSDIEPDTSNKALERRAPRFATMHYFLKRSGLWRPLRAMAPVRLRSGSFRSGSSLTLDPADRRVLVDYYREDVSALAALLDRDLSAWLR
ncbi:MAG TPA: sulfotransferase [Candidatus Acidoferrum sp.]|nr:sulfotransferase [Candidatus Acidoferrum sp.]